MELLSTIEARETDRIERAASYERLKNRQYSLTNTILRLSSNQGTSEALEEIRRLSAAVPEGLISSQDPSAR